METIFSKSHSGRRGSSLPEPDVPCTDALPPELRRAEPAAMPEVSELDGVRHFVNLSRRNMAIDTCFYVGYGVHDYNIQPGQRPWLINLGLLKKKACQGLCLKLSQDIICHYNLEEYCQRTY
ncbi:MAG: hypothetical protein HON70_09535 [Lentisphaerae bacterium]|nr:hypothetical protein [Lentisphaerota bacterium]